MDGMTCMAPGPAEGWLPNQDGSAQPTPSPAAALKAISRDSLAGTSSVSSTGGRVYRVVNRCRSSARARIKARIAGGWPPPRRGPDARVSGRRSSMICLASTLRWARASRPSTSASPAWLPRFPALAAVEIGAARALARTLG